ncbi:acyl carrier protein [Amniculicola lignicola CBS 123094]|uniref:Acyl carrier protein n=1 Tax=Amniculicola lignicola CBS 123094 TaxID=1392246 RepID=A0A6A5X4G0_9PLEO|nr:acyl carrier protein [Amniculicola lignicola CBS 123094]
MFRTALFRSARQAVRAAPRCQTAIARPVVPRSLFQQKQIAPAAYFQAVRCYSASAGLSKDEVEGRIMDLLKNFDKVTDTSKLNSASHFHNDLGLDSLDTVEVVMAIEEEFSIEIPDKEADAIHSVKQAVDYIVAQPDGEDAPAPH